MTLLDYSNKLFTWFLEKDYFIPSKHTAELIPISDNKEIDRKIDEAGLTATLEEFEKQNLVRRGSIIEKNSKGQEVNWHDVYFLKQPLNSYEQNISIPGPMASLISKIINSYCSITSDNENLCDAKNLQTVDLQKILVIIDQLISENNKLPKI